MGLTANSTGRNAVDNGLVIRKQAESDQVIALAGNPNVGKSTVFNELTGLNQHTGNWPGKTVTNAQGRHTGSNGDFILVDLPGTYSLMAHSAEEEVARDFICFGGADAVIVVCDATCLERNLNLVLQTIEITKNVVVCVNLMDEAKRKGIRIDLEELERSLGVPVVGAAARSRKGLDQLMERTATLKQFREEHDILPIRYIQPIEDAIALVEPVIREKITGKLNPRWTALKLIDADETLNKSMTECLGMNLSEDTAVQEALTSARKRLEAANIPQDRLKDKITACLVLTAEGVCTDTVFEENRACNQRDRKLDRILTNRWTGIPIMLLMLCLVFWLTICAANYPSQLLSAGLFHVQDLLTDFVHWTGAPEWVNGLFVEGMYRTLAWMSVESWCPSPITYHKKTRERNPNKGFLSRVFL